MNETEIEVSVDTWLLHKTCPICKSDKIISVGKPYLAGNKVNQKIMCDGCSNWTGHEIYVLEGVTGKGDKFDDYPNYESSNVRTFAEGGIQ